jgi:hypothetical protein
MAQFPPTKNITKLAEKKTAAGWTGGTIKGTRQDVIAAISASALTEAKKAAVVEDIELMDSKHELIRVDFHRHAHQGGWNCTYTITEL